MKKQFLIAMISIIFSTSAIAMFQEQKEDLIDSLFLGRYNSSLKESYFQALEEDEDTYNQVISEAALFFGKELEKEQDTEKAQLAYAYAYYYDPRNENIPGKALRIMLSFPDPIETTKQEFIRQVMKIRPIT